MTICQGIAKLVAYGRKKGLIPEEDRTYMINRYLEVMGETAYDLTEEEEKRAEAEETPLPDILEALTKAAFEKGLIPDDGITQRDLFDTKLMGLMTPPPHEAIALFREKYASSPEEATDWFYALSRDTNYIRRDRVAKDRRWTVASPYGRIDISINLSKPEKDPRAIAAAGAARQTAYPLCQLCMENEGYAGRLDHPARQNHRIMPIKIKGQDWGFQYSPYVYYNEHCIVFNGRHVPMKIDREAFEKLFSFEEQFPHYFLGSNADLPIVGGSILSHDHFQGGHYEFAMERAEIEKTYVIPGFEDVSCGIVRWPLSVLRLDGTDYHRVIDLADHILKTWRTYTDEAAFIYAETDGQPHNTITPIARRRGELYELDLALRNNITTEDYPLGVYHPHAQYHHIKKENIGLIEVMGLAILPARLDKEMALLEDCLTEGVPFSEYPELDKHADWAEEVRKKHPELTKENVRAILEEEIGEVFVHVLEDAGVYKCTPEGREAFERFVKALG